MLQIQTGLQYGLALFSNFLQGYILVENCRYKQSAVLYGFCKQIILEAPHEKGTKEAN